jgi:hypothetical protein
MKGNDDKRQHVIPFMKCFTGLVGAFTPEEVIFMLYMADRTRLREKGYDTLRSKRYYMENMEMGSRIFDKCVEKTTRMGLLERVPVSGMYDYLWHMDSYNRLVGILAEILFLPGHSVIGCSMWKKGPWHPSLTKRSANGKRDTEKFERICPRNVNE